MIFVPLTTTLLRGAIATCADPATRQLAAEIPDVHRRLLGPGAHCEAALDDIGIIGAAGVTPHWYGRAEAWVMLAPRVTRAQRVAIWRRCQVVLAELASNPAFRRIEMYVRTDAPWSHTFPRLLGFELEGTARSWCPAGRDFHLFARITRRARLLYMESDRHG